MIRTLLIARGDTSYDPPWLLATNRAGASRKMPVDDASRRDLANVPFGGPKLYGSMGVTFNASP